MKEVFILWLGETPIGYRLTAWNKPLLRLNGRDFRKINVWKSYSDEPENRNLSV